MPNFKIGDRVKLITSRYGDYRENPIWDGEQGKIAGTIKLLPALATNILVNWDNGAQNSYYNSDLEIIKHKKLTPIFTKKNMTTKQKTKVIVTIERIKGETFLKFIVSPELQKIWSTKSKEIKTSENWKGLQFYYCPDTVGSSEYCDLLSNYGLIDDFGHKVFENRKFNIAFLRAVGGVGKIKINNEISFAEVSNSIKRTTAFLKNYFEEYTRDFAVKGIINFEV